MVSSSCSERECVVDTGSNIVKSLRLLASVLLLAAPAAAQLTSVPETPEQIEQRLEQLRQLDAEAAIRRQETLEFQSRRRKEEYARRWKRYGDEEVDVLKWWQQKDGTWVDGHKATEVPARPPWSPQRGQDLREGA